MIKARQLESWKFAWREGDIELLPPKLEEHLGPTDPRHGEHDQRSHAGTGVGLAVVTDPDDRRDLEHSRDALRARIEKQDMDAFRDYDAGKDLFPDGRWAMVWSWADIMSSRDRQIDMAIEIGAPGSTQDPTLLPAAQGFRTQYEAAFAKAVKGRGLEYYRHKDAVIVTPIRSNLREPESPMNQHFGGDNKLTKLREALGGKVKGARISSHIFPMAGYPGYMQGQIERYRSILAKLGQGPGARFKRKPTGPVELKPMPFVLGVRPYDAPALHNAREAFAIPFEIESGGRPQFKDVEDAENAGWQFFMPRTKLREFVDMRALEVTHQELMDLRRTFPNVPLRWGLNSDKGDVFARAFGYQGYIQFNPRYYTDPAMFYYRHAWASKSGFHPFGTGPLGATATHEFGHLVHYWLEREARTIQGPLAPKVKDIIDRYMPTITGRGLSSYAQRRLVERFAESTSEYSRGRGGEESTHRESFAEAFSALRWTPADRWSPPTLSMNQMFKELWQEVPEVMGKPVTSAP